MIRGRFAPTPSGTMHLGNAKIALLSWLQVRAANGVFVLRIEDIDMQRSKSELARQIIADMKWLGLNWDEGPGQGGNYGPYTQSERRDRYEQALQELEHKGRLYPCYCSRAELLQIAGAPHGLASEGPVYPGTCRKLTPQEREERALHKTSSLRFALQNEQYEVQDGIAGFQHFPEASGGDFIVKRADGMYSYQLAVTVDDAAMGITHVLRGSDLLDSTPRQLALYEAFGWQPPQFAHAPLLMGEDGRRLAKRHGDLSLVQLRRSGLPAERVIGWLAYISGLIDRPEPVQASELVTGFTLDLISKSPFTLTSQMVQQLLADSR
ncbi:tRNA glutamyl-Q(34) synthetase GluQRS [Paenibacillus physcomitrellae]|uniref:Glutamyl-Q tRNA(Asp) synthetase n=1 Tax=Paenibacillus physcomitrellae TaxID=1619311 RepID=A0ABQ1G8E7_9BACL|nr:tRNA glutamyl-Q(34) synthetase GluQRS [Paenibacillus physcomitrellae]GGA38758.1 glutamyl-Q tRNA(Asp) synthetase [Paenibacillus physcomitrellae]